MMVVDPGLHVAALYIEHEAHISQLAVVLTTAVPLAVYVICLRIEPSPG
jgi:hypothetical protein